MGICDILQTLLQKAYFLWELVLPRKYINGNSITSDASLWTEVSASKEDFSSIRPKVVTWPSESYSGLFRYRGYQLRVGRRIAEGGQADIYEAHVFSQATGRSSMVVKKFKALVGIVHGLLPLQLFSYKNMFVCKPKGFYFDSDGSVCMVMYRYSGDLRDLIDSQMKSRLDDGPPFAESVAVSIIMQLALGLRSLHGSKIYHRDLKCKNILVQRDLKKLLISSGVLDMDFAVAISDFESSDDVQGTGFWRAPEVLQSLDGTVTKSGIQWEKADVYSFGMTCYEILTGRLPFHDHQRTGYNVVLSGRRPELPSHVPQGLRGIIQKCWHEDPNERPTFAEIVSLLKENYTELWDVGFRKVESVISWESSLETSDAVLLELVRLVHKLKNRKETASLFIDTVKEFVSRFGWRSYATHPSLPLVGFVERERLCFSMRLQFYEEHDFYYEYFHCAKDAGFSTTTQMFLLMEKVFFIAIDGACRSVYSESAHGEGLILSEKLSIIERAFVEPLLDGGANKLLIFKEARLLIPDEFSKEDLQEGIEQFQIRFMISILLLVVPEFLLRMARLEGSVGFLKVKILTKLILSSFPSIRILARQSFLGHVHIRSFDFLKVFVGPFAIDLFLPVLTFFLQLRLLGWRSLLGWGLVEGILKSFCFLTWTSRGPALESSTLVLHRICYLTICYVLEMNWTHYLAISLK